MSNSTPPMEPTIGAFELKTILEQSGLGQYEQRLRENGFTDWPSVTAIAEQDMADMDFRLGDRRKLQRVIRQHNTASPPQPYTSTQSPRPLARPTRAYRKRPRADSNAPVKPKTAYVLFGEHVRQDPSLSNLPFADLAKETGRRWKDISSEEREHVWEAPAKKRSKDYRDEFDRYKQSDNYRKYQNYLENFKRKHNTVDHTDSPDQNSSPELTTSSGELPALEVLERIEALRWGSVDNDQHMENQDMQGLPEDVSEPVKSGIEEVHRVSRNLGINLHLVRVATFPQEDITTKAVETFLQGTGTLVYFWTHEEATELIRSVYHQQPDVTLKRAADILAMAAVGSYCDGEGTTALHREKFFEFFVYMLSSPLQSSDLHRMRLFACLAICRFTTNVESARILMLSALGIGRMKFASQEFRDKTSDKDLYRWWNVFRSLVFLESWFAFNTNHESRITTEDLNLYQSSLPAASSGLGMFQERMIELGQLASYAAVDLRFANQPEVTHARRYLDTFNLWHRTLPPPMQLSRLSLADPFSTERHTKRSLLQLHVLFLGLFIEPYRQCLLDLGSCRLGDKSIGQEDLDALKNVEEQCIMVARQSSRVVSLLQTDNLIRSHCWVSIYTAFVGCSILLYGASQKLLLGRGEEVSLELAYASSHIGILSLCSYDNETARAMYTMIQVIFNEIREVAASNIYNSMWGRNNTASGNTPAYTPLSQGQMAQTPEDIRTAIVDTVKRVMRLLREKIKF